MELYEFITPSDPITFYASDNDIAEAIGLVIGGGKAAIAYTDKKRDKEPIPNTMTVFSGWDNGQQARVNKTMEDRTEEVLAAGKTFAVCKPGLRYEYDKMTDNATNEKEIAEWDDRHRSSMNNWCKFARTLRPKSHA